MIKRIKEVGSLQSTDLRVTSSRDVLRTSCWYGAARTDKDKTRPPAPWLMHLREPFAWQKTSLRYTSCYLIHEIFIWIQTIISLVQFIKKIITIYHINMVNYKKKYRVDILTSKLRISRIFNPK
jgi:hypothetical protein